MNLDGLPCLDAAEEKLVFRERFSAPMGGETITFTELLDQDREDMQLPVPLPPVSYELSMPSYTGLRAILSGVKKGKGAKVEEEEVKKSKSVMKKLEERQKLRSLDPALDDQFVSGRIYAAISSRPGQSGRSDGYILEGKELEFYSRKLKQRKGGK